MWLRGLLIQGVCDHKPFNTIHIACPWPLQGQGGLRGGGRWGGQILVPQSVHGSVDCFGALPVCIHPMCCFCYVLHVFHAHIIYGLLYCTGMCMYIHVLLHIHVHACSHATYVAYRGCQNVPCDTSLLLPLRISNLYTCITEHTCPIGDTKCHVHHGSPPFGD